MSSQPADPPVGESLELSVEDVLRRAQPMPPREEIVLPDLTDEEQEAFWAAINE